MMDIKAQSGQSIGTDYKDKKKTELVAGRNIEPTLEDIRAEARYFSETLDQCRKENSILRQQLAEQTSSAVGYVTVPHLVRGETLGKVAAFKAFTKAMRSEMPMNEDGSYSGTFNHAVQEAINAYLTVNHSEPYGEKSTPPSVEVLLEALRKIVEQDVSGLVCEQIANDALNAYSSKPQKQDLGN
jgi:hypothetical protein